MHKVPLKKPYYAILFIAFYSSVVISCKSDPIEPEQLTPASIQGANYQWGDLSINRKNASDILEYNEEGQIISLSTTDDRNGLTTVSFNYQANKIFLNTEFDDTYELDSKGRVALHSSSQVQAGMTFVNTQKYTYDNAGYLAKIDLAINNVVYSVITYEVKNRNYNSFVLSNLEDGKITRRYVYSYNSKKATSSFSMFTAVFANNTNSSVEKYLNFGKQSMNELSSIKYEIVNLDGSPRNGVLKAINRLDDRNNIVGIELIGDEIKGMPSDNLSPLPRNVSIVLKK